MNPLNAVALGVLVALALKRKNARDNLDTWRWIAGAVGALFPYSEVFLFFMGEGVWAQGSRALLWTLMVMPISAVGLAGLLGLFARKSWEEFFYPVVGGLGAAWVLGALTERGIFPFALLWDWRLALGVLDSVDIILLVICCVGLGMAYAFKIYDRDLSRMTLGIVVGYVGLVGYWSYQAREFGNHYAVLQEMTGYKVTVEPQVLSPLNWRVTVLEQNGRMHDTLITLGRDDGKKSGVEGPYKPRDEAVWKIYRRYGDDALVTAEEQRKVRLAWYDFMDTPFGWMARYSVFERMYEPQEVGMTTRCFGFKDIRTSHAEGTFVVCPWRERVRVFQPDGRKDKSGKWLGMHELLPYTL